MSTTLEERKRLSWHDRDKGEGQWQLWTACCACNQMNHCRGKARDLMRCFRCYMDDAKPIVQKQERQQPIEIPEVLDQGPERHVWDVSPYIDPKSPYGRWYLERRAELEQAKTWANDSPAVRPHAETMVKCDELSEQAVNNPAIHLPVVAPSRGTFDAMKEKRLLPQHLEVPTPEELRRHRDKFGSECVNEVADAYGIDLTATTEKRKPKRLSSTKSRRTSERARRALEEV